MNYKDELKKIYDTDIPIYEDKILNKDIILYGAGSLGHMALDIFKKTNIKPKYLIDKTITGKINNVDIKNTDQIPKADKANALFLICISAQPYNIIFHSLKKLGIRNIMHVYTYIYIKFPQLLGNGWFHYNLTKTDTINIEKVCEILSHDELSLSHYLQFLWWKLRGVEKIYDNYFVLSGKKFFQSPCLPKLNNNEVLLDCGCHFGQTIDGFMKITENKFSQIYAIEPDIKNLEVCKKKYSDERITYYNIAVSNFNGESCFINDMGYASKLNKKGNTKIEVKTIDTLNLNPTILKLHIEGEELNALNGGVGTIDKYNPILMVLADHNIDGLYAIPFFMYHHSYKIYFNLHDYCGNSAVFYGGRK